MRSEPLELLEGLRWYTIRTKSKKEAAVADWLSSLQLEVFLPWLRCRRRIGTRYQWSLAPLFPGYLFCRLDLMRSGKAARYAPGVKDFVKFGCRFAELEEDVLESLRERCPDGVAEVKPPLYRAGETVLIREGPFAGLEGLFEQEMKGSERVAVLLDLLGRRTKLILSSNMIARP
jgi:transcriptional antiterminator RfaH